MKQHLNTLFVTTEGSYLGKDGQAIAIRQEQKIVHRVPLHNLGGVVCFGRISASPQLMAACAESGVTLSFVDDHGRFRAAVVGYTPGNVLLRRTQYRWADDETKSLSVAQQIVAAKIANSRSVLQLGIRDFTSSPSKTTSLQRASDLLAVHLQDARRANNLDQLRGIEGQAAHLYFDTFPELITLSDPAFSFEKRSRRPPLDPVNCLLSFLYAMLAHDLRSACECAGLDAAVGFLHRDRPGRPGLALDLMEEFRPFLVDRLVLSLINRRQVNPDGFETTASGAVRMTDNTRKTVLVAYQKRKQQELIHPFLHEKTSIGLFFHLQARLLARHLRGDLDAYPPFLWR
ncbi:Subtype I-C CRISPR-associated endonuclease Cas1 [Planctomycetales bacterium 10988]|nr:Subtype I-C CRISPR-associated endonuclease Cas1 [Planctomycetales bacterium 10988]